MLLSLALREVEDDGPAPFLVALQQRPVREVFDVAAALVHDSEAARRALGVRILRELGQVQPDGRRPFSAETIPLLRARLLNEWDVIGVFDPERNIDEYDCLIGPLLVNLAEDSDAATIRNLLDDEIRDHFGMSPAHVDTAGMAQRLVGWWREAAR